MYFNNDDITNLIIMIKKINFMDELVRLTYDINLINEVDYKAKYKMNDALYKKIIKLKNKYNIEKIFEVFSYIYEKVN